MRSSTIGSSPSAAASGSTVRRQRSSGERTIARIGSAADPLDERLRLLAALVVEVDAVGAAGQRVRGVRGRPAVPQQDDRHVADTTPVPSRTSTTVPSTTR